MPSSDWTVVWLAVGAISLALMALLQIGAIVALLKVGMEALRTVRGLQAQVGPLINRGEALLTSAGDVVHQAQGVVASAAAQVKRVEGGVALASAGLTNVHRGVRHVTARANGAVSAVQAFWAVVRGRRRDVDSLNERDNAD